MRDVFKNAERIWLSYGQECVVTAGLDGKHSAGSYHYFGRAVDLRTRYFSTAEKQLVVDELRASLPNDYFVLLESTHIHVQYNSHEKKKIHPSSDYARLLSAAQDVVFWDWTTLDEEGVGDGVEAITYLNIVLKEIETGERV